jgi:hypothetical protein
MTLVFPAGHYVGERHPERHHVVRLGMKHHRLTADEFGVWVLAHGTAEIGKGAWTVDALVDLAESAALPDARLAVSGLTGTGLLTTVDGPAAARRFAEGHRVHPLLTGLGNTEDEPDRYQLGFPGIPPVAVVDTSTYELWQWGHVAPTLWQACEVREKVAAGLGTRTAAADLLTESLGDLRVLLANSCAFLDLAVR